METLKEVGKIIYELGWGSILFASSIWMLIVAYEYIKQNIIEEYLEKQKNKG